MKKVTTPELIQTLEWLAEYLQRNPLGTIETEHGVGTIVDAHLLKAKLAYAIAEARRGVNPLEWRILEHMDAMRPLLDQWAEKKETK